MKILSDFLAFYVRAGGFLHLRIVLVVKPSLVYVVTNASIVLADHPHDMRTWHPRPEIVFAFASPAPVLYIVHQSKPILALILHITDIPMDWRSSRLNRSELP